MTKGRLQHVTNQYRAALRAHESQAEHALGQAYAGVLKTLEPALDKLYTDMANKLATGEKIPLTWLHEAGRLEGIKKLITGQIDHFSLLSQLQVTQAQQYAVSLGQKSAMDMLNATAPTGFSYTFGVPHPAAIASLVGATQNGSPLADLFNGFGREAAQKVGQALITGITMGDNPRTVARSVADALGVSRARALTISRTSMLDAYRSANVAVYQANSDVVESMIRVAYLSPRTCVVCIALNGTVYALDDDPGFHPNDRCVLVPKTRSWADILGPDVDTSDIPETTIEMQSGSEWLDSQSEATQREVLGAKYDGWANGDFTLDDIVGHTYSADWGHSIREKSLKELTNS
jgi:SPP1 gp7 family putative phage head morphogenesis protein